MKWTLPALLLVGACAAPAAPRPATASAHARAMPVLLVDSVDGLGLFRDESRAAEEQVFAWARARGFTLVPVDRASEIFARARSGRRVDGAGEQCGWPVSRWRAQELDARALGAGGMLRTSVSCAADSQRCTLEVTASSGMGFSGDQLLHESAPYDVATPVAVALPRALAALAPVVDEDGAGGLGLGGLGGGGAVVAHPERLAWRASSALASDRDHFSGESAIGFPGGAAPLRSCFQADTRDVEALIAVDGAGRITRCESREADDPFSLCVCDRLIGEARTSSALRSTRAFVAVSFQPADVVTPWRGVVTASTRTYLDSYRSVDGQTLWRPSVSDPSIAPWQPPPDDAIARCFADAPSPGRGDASVTVHFDALGAPASVEVTPVRNSFTAAQRSCVERAFFASRTPCPAVPQSTARATVQVTARAITE